MKKGDRAFFYHSNEGKEIVGVVEVVREAYPDPTAEKGDWVCVDMKAVAPMPKPVTLVAIKADPKFADLGAGAAVAAVGGAGVEAALGPDLQDGWDGKALIPPAAGARSAAWHDIADGTSEGLPARRRAASPACSPSARATRSTST